MENPGKAFYEQWAKKMVNNPDREIGLKWKAVNLANLYFRTMKSKAVHNICEIGGAEGIVLHTLGVILNTSRLVNFELSSEFCRIGQAKYPEIEFYNCEFNIPEKPLYNLIILSDIIEHVENEELLLTEVSNSCHYALIKIPIEECVTNQNWYYRLRGKRKPPEKCYGTYHENGHLRGYTIRRAINSISTYFNILDMGLSDVTYFYGTRKHHLLKRWLGTQLMVRFFGGALFLLGESKRISKVG